MLRVDIKEVGKKVAIKAAEHYANVSCPLVLGQPKLPEAVKKLSKN